jgi:hypothetical protein
MENGAGLQSRYDVHAGTFWDRHLILKTANLIAAGAYSDIFQPIPDGKVYKLFDSVQHPDRIWNFGNRPEDNERRRKVFHSECEAYNLAGSNLFLRDHIPHFFGSCEIESVIGPNRPVDEHYLRGCCYVMEYIDDSPIKLGEIRSDFPGHIREALRHFKEAGIDYLEDASIFFVDDPQEFKFIDFAVRDYPLMAHED